MLWHVEVETGTPDGSIIVYDTVVLAHTERSAKVAATRAITVSRAVTDARSLTATQLDISKTGVVFAVARSLQSPMTRKEAAVGQW